jgi:hypothetical protein
MLTARRKRGCRVFGGKTAAGWRGVPAGTTDRLGPPARASCNGSNFAFDANFFRIDFDALGGDALGGRADGSPLSARIRLRACPANVLRALDRSEPDCSQ